MRRFQLLTVAALLACCLNASAQVAKKAEEPASCGDFGTAVHFEKTPSDAARKALKEEKLVCVLHISGYFEEPDYT